MAKNADITAWFGIPRTRTEARSTNHKYYFTGKPCIHGHVSVRDSNDRKCLECEAAFVKRRYNNPEHKAKFLAWSRANKDKRLAASKKSKAKHSEAVRRRAREWWSRNREDRAEKRRAWVARSRAAIYAANAKRRGLRLQATPPWADRFKSEFKAIYAERMRISKETGVQHHVDHIYPLKGKNSCGLHVPWNLRIITASENSKKRNNPPDENTIKQWMASGYNQKCADFANNAADAR